MARGVNKVILIGRLGQDPETRYTQSGSAVTNLNLATSESWRDKNTGDMVENTEWHRVVAFARLAEIMSEYLKKGSQVYIEGRLQTRKWQDKNGMDRYTTEIVANEMQMLDSRQGAGGMGGGAPFPGGGQPQGGGMGGGQPAGNQGGYGGGQPQQAARPASPPPPPADDFDDDIPF